jgi:tetratricopeptide (TPR) repeat protein
MRKIFLLFLLLKPGMPEGAFKTTVFADGEQGLSCGPAIRAAGLRPDATGRYAPVFPGWGHYHYKITTTNDSAQFYFDQGLSLYYGYHLTEAAASFREAARNDSSCVMAYWGEALAMGPYYNDTYYYKMPLAVLPVIDQMNRLTAMASPKEQDLIAVMKQRYDADTSIGHRVELNRIYSEGIGKLVGKYPGDPDIKALYVDGRMIEHAWDMWDNKGMARPWTPELIGYCEEILTANAEHPAALHYYIHLEEASRHPEAALHSADVLQALMPGVAHMVHMASHMYQRTGLYAKGVSINDRANAAVTNYSGLATQLHLGVYSAHYYSVEAFCALNGGLYEKGMQIARESRRMLLLNPSSMQRAGIQYHFMMPVFVAVRMGKWQEVLDLPAPDSNRVYASALSDFARGLAFLRLGKRSAAEACLDSLRDRLKDPVLSIRVLPQNAPIKAASVAEGILEGEILFAAGRTTEAMAAFNRAIECEDGMSYGEPKDWPLPARHYAGVCWLKLGRAAEAEKLYREDLVENPGNGWALLGLYQSLVAQHKEAAEYQKRYRDAFAAADWMPVASAY